MENEKEKKGGKGFIIFMIFFLIGVICVAGYFVYQMIYIDNTSEKTIDNENQEEKLLYNLDIYKQNTSLCLEKTEYCNEIAFAIPTKTENTKVLGFDQEQLFILFKDEIEYKIYNIKTKTIEKIELKKEYKEYQLYPNENKEKIIGIVYKTNDDKIGYYNLNTKEELYEGKYDLKNIYELNQINDNYLSVSVYDKKETYLLSNTIEQEQLTFKFNEGPSYSFSSLGKGKYIYELLSCAGDCVVEKLYSNDLKEIYSKNISEQNISYKNNMVYFVENNKVNKVTMDGSITEYKSYNSIKGLIDNYVVYVNNGKLNLENLETGGIKEVCIWKDNYIYDTYTSGYWTRIQLDKINEIDKQEGLYIVVNYSTKDDNGNYGMEYCFKDSGDIVEYPITQEIGGRAKPVLYLYPTKKTDVKVEFQHPEYLTTTYPKYNNNWYVVAYPNGDLYDKDNKYYYGLYWDEIRYNEVDFHEGFYVEKENAINFLEEKLNIIGLNARERNEFIMYWLPILEQNEKNLVYFELTKERENGNDLIISPKPDSLLRLSIHIKKVNTKLNIKEQRLDTFKRVGFTVVEWGGMTY